MSPRLSPLLFLLLGCTDRQLPSFEPDIEAARVLFEPLCEQLLGCPCEQYDFVDVDACTLVYGSYLEGDRAAAASVGLVFDPACAVSQWHWYQDAGCMGSHEWESLESTDPLLGMVWACGSCQEIHGDKLSGEPCKAYSFSASDCAQGLFCLTTPGSAVCFDPCIPQQEGDPCSGWECGPNLACDGDTHVCIPELEDGAPCPEGYGCKDNFQCDETNLICIPDPGLGEPCSLYCAGRLLCREGICKEPAVAGEICDQDDCNREEGLYCHEGTHLCTPLGGEGDPCEVANFKASCIANFTCHQGLCVPLPNQGEPCTKSGCRDFYECVDEICVTAQPLVCNNV